MKKEVWITIKGLQFGQDTDGAEMETITYGEYYEKDGYHYLIFEESQEDTKEKNKSILKFNGNRLHMSKSGLVSVHMDFEQGQKNFSTYQTPFGGIMMGIDTYKVQLEEKKDEIHLMIEYDLEVNYEHLAKCHIEVTATEKENGVSLQ